MPRNPEIFWTRFKAALSRIGASGGSRNFLRGGLRLPNFPSERLARFARSPGFTASKAYTGRAKRARNFPLLRVLLCWIKIYSLQYTLGIKLTSGMYLWTRFTKTQQLNWNKNGRNSASKWTTWLGERSEPEIFFNYDVISIEKTACWALFGIILNFQSHLEGRGLSPLHLLLPNIDKM